MNKWRKDRPPARDGDRFVLRMGKPKLKGKGRRTVYAPSLIEIKDGKPHFVLTKTVEFLSPASDFRPDLGDRWKPLAKERAR